jgi:maltooligosyltrehalose trehalohydrolase
MTGFRPSLGAWPEKGGVRFRVWAPEHGRVEVALEGDSGAVRAPPMERDGEGYWQALVPGIGAGALYRYRLDGEGPFPDPASRFQPEGVHGPSQVVDPARYEWRAEAWRGRDLDELVAYELHVGTFTPEGTFAGAMAKLEHLRALGVTALELMPLADFPGNRNWGYDGAALFAPARSYGTPDDLRRLVDRAHLLGLGVILDVVYNHLGPDGAYLACFSPRYFTDRHRTPWGAALNFDGDGSEHVRAFFVENALHWLGEYRFDGLRLDATHAIHDGSARHLLAELPARARASVGDRRLLMIAEDNRNLAHMVRGEASQGLGLDAVWADDLHHQLRRHLAGDCDGYYEDYSGTARDVAETLRDGWFYKGQRSTYLDRPRGTDPTGEPPRRYVVCLQNHDQVGNRAHGERLHHQVDEAAFRAATALLLLAPETPLVFMGQEWAASSPFLYFTDHAAELGRLVTEGRRREFARFAAFADAVARARIPDPQAESTFAASRLDWSERPEERHARVERLYRALLDLRKQERPARAERGAFHVRPLDSGALAFHVAPRSGVARHLLAVVRLSGAGAARIDADGLFLPRGAAWREALATEEACFAADARPASVVRDREDLVATFSRPGAIVLTADPPPFA